MLSLISMEINKYVRIRYYESHGYNSPRNLQRDALNGPLSPEYLIDRSQLPERGPLGFGPIQFLVEILSIWRVFGNSFFFASPKKTWPKHHHRWLPCPDAVVGGPFFCQRNVGTWERCEFAPKGIPYPLETNIGGVLKWWLSPTTMGFSY